MRLNVTQITQEVKNTFCLMLGEQEILELKEMEKEYIPLKFSVYVCRQKAEWVYYFIIKGYKQEFETDLGIETLYDGLIQETNKFNTVKEMVLHIINNCDSLSISPL